MAPTRPTQLGPYEVVVKIAGGGLSTIYLARNSSTGGLPVALKVVRSDLSEDDRVVKMFHEESRILARLDHPNLVRTLDASHAHDARYIAMELMLGVTLASVYEAVVARNVRLNAELVAWIAGRVALALDHAHTLRDEAGQPFGVIHRDVNPRNVMLTFDGGVKLFDFGLAKPTARKAPSSPGIVKGTLPYVSPEQIMQSALDGRSDVFGLGTTMWELLTSKRLFRRDTDQDTVRAVQRGPIPDVRTIAPEVAAELSPIVKKALERNREHRYASARDFADELEAFTRARKVDDGPARIAKLVSTLFPDEEKRQRGWLKPPPSGSGIPSVRPPRDK